MLFLDILAKTLAQLAFQRNFYCKKYLPGKRIFVSLCLNILKRKVMAVSKEKPNTTKQEPLPFDEQIINSIVINGDISKLSPQQKISYYRQFCERLGLDPLSQPFKLLKLNGREILYCDRTGAQQLNKLHKVSHEIRARETVSGCYVVTAQASTPDGRHTESIGAVTIENMRGDALCNAMMKAETKAKRRATLDLLGLGILDETETETIANAQTMEAPAVMPSAAQPVSNSRISPFKQKYESVEEIDAVLDKASDVKDIANLYYINAELVEATPDLKARFSTKKTEFYAAPSADRLAA